jgi:hypothetical protein
VLVPAVAADSAAADDPSVLARGSSHSAAGVLLRLIRGSEGLLPEVPSTASSVCAAMCGVVDVRFRV